LAAVGQSGESDVLGGHRATPAHSVVDAGHVCAGELARVFRPWYYYGMKVAVSIPNQLFDSAETLGRKLGVSRSRLYATALAEFLAKHRGRKTTARLDAVYGSESGRLDPGVRRLQARSLGESSW